MSERGTVMVSNMTGKLRHNLRESTAENEWSKTGFQFFGVLVPGNLKTPITFKPRTKNEKQSQ